MIKTYTDCPVEYTASLLGNKWKPLILRELLSGTKRYNELTRNVVGISPKVLTENLRELEEDGVISRKVYPEVPPKVEYSLTEKGNDLKDIIEAMKTFGIKYKKQE
ncbi:MAG: helix-turn-helix transcriptional regulator [Erysipelotrichaceae bacterium]|nr:helix-turn-helix transcriptional regulator [Erysipelotrichaceae bacterium]